MKQRRAETTFAGNAYPPPTSAPISANNPQSLSNIILQRCLQILVKFLAKMSRLILVTLAVIALSNAQAFKRLRNNDRCTDAGFYQDANDCQKFYRCAEHETLEGGSIVNKFEFRCPPGTAFDESISTCNYPSNVDGITEQCMAQVESTLDEIRNRVDTYSQRDSTLQIPGSYNQGHPQLHYTQAPAAYQRQPLYQVQPQQAVYQVPSKLQVLYG
ncbi:unnamed protein product [Allacma fusca]|uniref:Chitin-binding type-2 domain-containing protein n=1 Tax=Allacma fusca TaxID=39272 RepID=A0A8J2LLC2_9HEXA|nr:unnamed protein product [Allacma fusca]